MRFLTSGAAAALLLASMAPAVAQMSPAPPPPPPPPMAPPPPPPVMVSAFNWTGVYAGIEIGADWGKFPGSVSTGAVAASPATAALPAARVPLYENYSGGFTGGGQIGYNWQFPSNWVFGGEVDFKGDVDRPTRTTTLGGPGLTPLPVRAPFLAGDSFRASSSWNGSARLRLGHAWGPVLPYITGGVAFADVELARSQISAANPAPFAGRTPVSTGSFSDTLVGWTIGAGIEYALNPSWSLGGEYRYADYGSTTGSLGTLPIAVAPAPAVSTPVTGKVGLQEHSLLFKLNYHFGAPPPPPPPAPMAAPAPPPAAPRVFIVFFDWDRDAITPEGQQIIAQAAEAYRSGAPVQIQVTGYTDRSGSPGYNQRLSERRANNVAKALAAMGVPPTQMAVSGRGENDNRVPTADGVREPQNRRVEIVAQ